MIRIFLIVIVSIWVMNILLRSPRGAIEGNSSAWKVYGSMGCGWTRKQIDELKKNGVPYEFLDCTGDICKDGMPVNILPDGSKRLGFTKAS